jgi:hypothetical protein
MGEVAGLPLDAVAYVPHKRSTPQGGEASHGPLASTSTRRNVLSYDLVVQRNSWGREWWDLQ